VVVAICQKFFSVDFIGCSSRFCGQARGAASTLMVVVRGHPLRSLRSASPSLSEGVLCITSLTTDSRSDHVRLPVARPLWIPAFAGMTEVMHSTRRGGNKIDRTPRRVK